METGLLIAQVGRSGGTWLSQQLALDKRWTVRHEDGGIASRGFTLGYMQARLRVPFFCDVSHLHNEIAEWLPCKKAVILRHPAEVFESYAARTQESKTRFLDRVDGMYLGLHRMLRQDAMLIRFDLMVKDPEYLEHVTQLLGFDLPMDKVNWKPTNVRRSHPPMPAVWKGRLDRAAMRVWRSWT